MEKYIGEERTLSELTEDIKQALQVRRLQLTMHVRLNAPPLSL